MFLNELARSLETNTKFNQAKFEIDVFNQVEQPFTMQKGINLITQAQSKC